MRGPVRVDWIDASFELDGGAQPPDSFDVETYGWIVGTTPTFISVASERLPDGAYRCLSYIPQTLVRNVVDLYEGGSQ
jgi:hypothetical protein